MRVNKTLKYKKTLSFFIHNKGYLRQHSNCLDKSMNSFILGKRNKTFYYDTHSSLIGINNSMKVLENILSHKGNIFFIGGDIPLIKSLLCFSKNEQTNIKVLPWYFSNITKLKTFDLLFLHEVNKKSILESYNKTAPYIGVNSFNFKDLSYIFNLSIDNKVLLNWYMYVIILSCRNGLYRSINKKDEI